MDTLIIIGCNYHTTWQSNKNMRFVLVALLGDDRAVLQTRVTNKRFTTKVSDLIFIESEHNKRKAQRLTLTKPQTNGTNSRNDTSTKGRNVYEG